MWRKVSARDSSLARGLLACSALGVALAACSTGGSDAQTDASGTGGGFQFGIELPTEVEQRLTEVMVELGTIVCERSAQCCEMYGFRALADCSEPAGAILTARLTSVWLDGGVEEFDLSIDERFVAACLEETRALSTKCTFEGESLFPPSLCARSLSATKKGEAPVECSSQEECTVLYGSGYACVLEHCIPEVVVPFGEQCTADGETPSAPVCGESGYCDISDAGRICKERKEPGEACYDADQNDSCVDGYACMEVLLEDGTYVENECMPRRGTGSACIEGDDCIEGTCSCPEGANGDCATQSCLHFVTNGDPCSTEDDCFPYTCREGRCQPPRIGFCEDP